MKVDVNTNIHWYLGEEVKGLCDRKTSEAIKDLPLKFDIMYLTPTSKITSKKDKRIMNLPHQATFPYLTELFEYAGDFLPAPKLVTALNFLFANGYIIAPMGKSKCCVQLKKAYCTMFLKNCDTFDEAIQYAVADYRERRIEYKY